MKRKLGRARDSNPPKAYSAGYLLSRTLSQAPPPHSRRALALGLISANEMDMRRLNRLVDPFVCRISPSENEPSTKALPWDIVHSTSPIIRLGNALETASPS